jgi:hypothetical protein
MTHLWVHRMYVCMYVCMYVRVCMHACMYVRMWTVASGSCFLGDNSIQTNLTPMPTHIFTAWRIKHWNNFPSPNFKVSKTTRQTWMGKSFTVTTQNMEWRTTGTGGKWHRWLQASSVLRSMAAWKFTTSTSIVTFTCPTPCEKQLQAHGVSNLWIIVNCEIHSQILEAVQNEICTF